MNVARPVLVFNEDPFWRRNTPSIVSARETATLPRVSPQLDDVDGVSPLTQLFDFLRAPMMFRRHQPRSPEENAVSYLQGGSRLVSPESPSVLPVNKSRCLERPPIGHTTFGPYCQRLAKAAVEFRVI